MAERLAFDDVDRVERAEGEPGLHVDVDGFEGPLDLLLELARRQKVDLHRISILALVEQYLAFIEEARRLRLELAADYLVMAAWLAYLKSRLLLPAPPRARRAAARSRRRCTTFWRPMRASGRNGRWPGSPCAGARYGRKSRRG